MHILARSQRGKILLQVDRLGRLERGIDHRVEGIGNIIT